MSAEEAYARLWRAMSALQEEARWMYNVGCDVKAEQLKAKAKGIELALKELGPAFGLHICPHCAMLGKLIRLEDDPYEPRPGTAYMCERCYDDYGPFDVEEVKHEP